MFYSLPTETKLDIFKCLSYKELCSISQTNICFRDFINYFERNLARQKLFKISIEYFDQSEEYPHKLIKPKAENLNFPLNNEQFEGKLKNGLEKPISLYLPDQFLVNNIDICLTEAKNDETPYRLQLPTIINTKEDVTNIYYYLNKLFNCFEYGYFEEFTFNPEAIELLFGNAKQVYIQKAWLLMDYYSIENKFQFILNHLIVSDLLRINFGRNIDTTEYTDILFKILMRGNKFNEVCLKACNLQNLFDIITNHIETSKDCSKMVAKIVLNNRYINFAIVNDSAEKVEDYFHLPNIYNPKIKFSILYSSHLKKLTIKRL